MKKTIALLLTLLINSSSWAAIAHVQTPDQVNCGSVTNCNLAFGSNNTAANFIGVGWSYAASGRTVTITDTRNTYTSSNAISATDAADAGTCGIGYALNIGAGANTVNVAVSGVASIMRVGITEFSGVATASAIDKTAGTSGTGSPVNAGSVTPTTNGQLLLVWARNSATSTWTAGTDFTLRFAAAQNSRVALETYVQPTAAAHNSDLTITGTPTWAAVVATFKEPAAGGGGSDVPFQRILVVE